MRRLAAIAGCAAAVLAAAVQTAHAATAQQAIALLNAQRAGNGLPANIIEDPRLTSDCAAHDRYMALNNALTHFEQTGAPGYTVGGAYAGKNAVLSERANWDNGNPYESAPLHLDLRKPRSIPVTNDIHVRRTTAKSPVSSQSWLRQYASAGFDRRFRDDDRRSSVLASSRPGFAMRQSLPRTTK